MPKPNSVKGSEPLPDESSELDPSDEGENPLEADDRPSANLAKEIERKVAKRTAELEKRLKGYEQELANVKSNQEERLEQLQSKPQLTLSEQQEMLQLERVVSEIEHDPKAKPWLELGRRQAEKIAIERIQQRDFDDAMDIVEEFAEKEGIDKDQFEDILLPFLKNYRGEERYTKKVKLAYKDYVQKREDSKELEEFRKGKPGGVRRETSQPARPQGRKEILDGAFKTRDFKDLLRGVEEVQAENRRNESRGS